MTTGALTFFGYGRLPEPYLLFHMRRRYVSPRTGLIRAGPYDADLHRNDDIHVGLIAGSSIAHNAKKLIELLRKGCSYYKGFKLIFKVNRLIFDDEFTEIIEDKSSNDILSRIENVYLELAEKLPNKSTIIVALNDEVVERNYARIKAVRFKYTKKTIRLQLIKRSTLERALRDATILDFTLLNVAAAIYAKAGGIPWVLERQLIPAGVFIGIAFTKPKVVSLNGQTKEIFYYGILTVYNKFGKYIDMTVRGIRMTINRGLRIRGTKGLYIPRNDVVEMLRRVINTYTPPVIIIHKSARFHTDEVETVRHVLRGKDISYALIHVESSNPYRGYGENKYDMTAVRGDLIVDRELDNRAILFTTGCIQGDRDIKGRVRPGTPRPLELEVEENTTPYNIRDFARQVLGLTKLDWNTTDLEVRMPITIKYARKVAALTQYISSTITDIRDIM